MRDDYGDLVYDARGNGDGKVVPTLTGDHENRITDYTAVSVCEQGTYQKTAGSLMANSHPGSYCGQDAYNDMLVAEKEPCTKSVVRRLTPLECERLQGYPDGWTAIGVPSVETIPDYERTYNEDGDVLTEVEVGCHKEIVYHYVDEKGKRRKLADSARYKVAGNSIALPFWYELLGRISEHCNEGETPTLGSLFDGIGGFPLCWEMHNGKGTARWASEIEPFPIEVTKRRFPEEEKRDNKEEEQ